MRKMRRDCFVWLVLSAALLFSCMNFWFLGSLMENYFYGSNSWHSQGDASATSTTVPGGITAGVQSKQRPQFFQNLQDTIDNDNHYARCQRYGFEYKPDKPPRRIFFGGLIADEPWELLEVVATEVHGVLAGVVFVESNRTQNLTPRNFKWLDKEKALQNLYGAPVIVQAYITEQHPVLRDDLERENGQRNEIVKVWKAMGMTEADVGYVGDVDETFSRDFLRAIQVCDGIQTLDYERHYCKNEMAKLVAEARVFESSPECIAMDRYWYHPDMIIGACIEGIGNSSLHPVAPREEQSVIDRKPGYGARPGDYANVRGKHYPLWNIADFRMTGGGWMHKLVAPTTMDITNSSDGGHHPQNYKSRYTAYHFHNWFPNFNTTRHKYYTYGEASSKAWELPLEDLEKGKLTLAYRCLLNMTERNTSYYHREPGGFKAALPPLPIYFADEDYRQLKHELARNEAVADEELRMKRLSQKQQTAATDEKGT